MNSTLWIRAIVFCLLLSLNGVMMIDYAHHAERQSPYPTAEEVKNDYQTHIGDQVNFWSQVSIVQEDTVGVTYGQPLYIQTSDLSVRSGDWVQVYGELNAKQELVVERIVVSPQSNRLYMIAVSVGGVLLALIMFVRHWKIDTKRWIIVPRDP
ncbi:uncharacterized protein HQ_1087A [Haloquadratum walsbyi DSM 16790]|uniref:Uncharacterized protein n=2 Tax=Haloquadratum walsbyi TaxID=293091 RepID=Q18DS1_HALWD|nr:uncharacterized protein HQ_1087A [Haloquadratum walsbyi DSM 16790]